MQPEITFNQEKNGIEIRFAEKPVTQVRTELYNMGFRYHRGKKFWYAPVTEARIVFAKQLQQTPDVTDNSQQQPSFEASVENISNGNFSYVTFAVKDDDRKVNLEDYIVFEPVKARAEELAKEFARERYGENLKELTVYPRNYKRKARVLFQHGQIIAHTLRQPEGTGPAIKEDGKQQIISPLVEPDGFVHKDRESEDLAEEQIQQDTNPLPDPLTNTHGVYTKETAGKNFERIEIEMTKSAKHEAQVDIVKTSQGDYRFGMHVQKFYGDYSGKGFAPNVEHEGYASRKDALTAALQAVYDHIKSGSEPDDKKVKLAAGAVLAHAAAEGIELAEKEVTHKAKKPEEKKNESNQPTVSETVATLAEQDLRSAQWTDVDDEYPVNKVIIHGTAYQQARLRKELIGRMSKLPLENQLAIAGKLKERFRERRSLETYDHSYVTYGKKGSERQTAIIGLYIDDIIIDNDLKHKDNPPVLTFLIDSLTGNKTESEQTVSAPEPGRKNDYHSAQFRLNREIENLVQEKDLKGTPFSEADKKFISQYNDHVPERPGRIPDQVAELIWKIAYSHSYNGGPVLNPSVGNGDLLRYAPKTVPITGYEYHGFAARIAQICYPYATIKQQPFESTFFDENDNHVKDQHEAPGFELVISHPPIGEFTGMFGFMDEKEWTHADQYADYCMTRGLDLLKRKGLLVFLMPLDFMKGPSSKVKEAIANKSHLEDALRIETLNSDIVVLRKR